MKSKHQSIKLLTIVTAMFQTALHDVKAAIPTDDVARITCETGAPAGCVSLETIFANIVSVAGILLGFAFFIMMILGGARLLLSGGDPKAVQAAKGTITWAIIGLAILALSYTILVLIQVFTGVNVTIFRIGV